MFKFLKEKLKQAVGLFTKEVKEKSVEEEVEVKKEEKPAAKPTPEQHRKPEKPAQVKQKQTEKERPIAKKEPKPQKPFPEKPKIEKPVDGFKKKEVEPEEEIETREEVKKTVQTEEKPGFFSRLFGRKEESKVKEVPVEVPQEKSVEQEAAVEKQSFFTRLKERVTKIQLGEERFEEIFQPLEIALLENNVALEVVEKIKKDLKEELMAERIHRKQVEQLIHDTLRKSIEDLFSVEGIDLLKKAKEKKPFVIAFFGVNGSGKTTTIAKFAHLFLKHKKSVVMAAADTFRAAAIQQLEEHANRLGVKLIKHDYESDPAAVAFDAIKHAQAKNIDVVLIDTAGRQHVNKNLMQELEKVIRVNKPDLKVFIGESITGNDCVEQAKQFNEAIGIDVIVLTKADVDEKGGAAISISYVTGKPIIYLGIGQKYEDLEPFDKGKILESVGL